MKQILSIILCTLSTGMLQAQTMERSIISTAGSTGLVAGVALDYTIGESVVATLSAGVEILTAGFQQPASSGVSIYETNDPSAFLQVYPNPASDVLNVMLNLPSQNEGLIQMTDITGRIVYSSQIKYELFNASVGQIPLRFFDPGTYMLSVVLEKEGSSFECIARRFQIVR